MAQPKLLLVAGIIAVAVAAFAQDAGVKKGPAPPTSVASGQQMYEAYCASCHGRSGKGDGPAAAALKIPPANLTTLAQRNGGKFPAAHVSEVIRNADVQAHGSSEMPVWGPVFRSMSEGHESDVRMRINNLAKYIESLQQK
jgi:mono/diheme cytochrome c family protein